MKNLLRLPIKEHGRKFNGFTLVELVITIAIVIILSVVSIPIYRGYTNNAKMAEGYALLGTILASQKAYYSQYGQFLADVDSGISNNNDFTCYTPVFNIDARGNKYFTSFNVCLTNPNIGWAFDAYVAKPVELIDGRSFLALYYNVTRGSTFLERNIKGD